MAGAGTGGRGSSKPYTPEELEDLEHRALVERRKDNIQVGL